MKYEWIKELSFSDYFPPDYMEMIEIVGIDKFLIMLERFGKTNFYFSLTSIEQMQKAYIIKNKDIPASKLARKLDASERTVFRTLNGDKVTDNLNLFESE